MQAAKGEGSRHNGTGKKQRATARLMVPRLAAAEHRALCRLHRHQLHPRLVLFQVPPSACRKQAKPRPRHSAQHSGTPGFPGTARPEGCQLCAASIPCLPA